MGGKVEAVFAGSLGNHLVKIEKCGSRVTLEKAEETLGCLAKISDILSFGHGKHALNAGAANEN